MSFFKRLFGNEKPESMPAEAPAVECPHISLVARWDSIEDMGHEDRATSFVCEACGASFSPEAGRKLRGEAGEKQWQRPV
jgi:hypothetical protein